LPLGSKQSIFPGYTDAERLGILVKNLTQNFYKFFFAVLKVNIKGSFMKALHFGNMYVLSPLASAKHEEICNQRNKILSEESKQPNKQNLSNVSEPKDYLYKLTQDPAMLEKDSPFVKCAIGKLPDGRKVVFTNTNTPGLKSTALWENLCKQELGYTPKSFLGAVLLLQQNSKVQFIFDPKETELIRKESSDLGKFNSIA
jgi:hypothetical protein